MEDKNSNKLIDADEAMKPLIKYIAVGLDEGLKRQLIEKSKQPHIADSTPSDLRERFGDSVMLSKWLEKGRIVHCMIGSDNDLAGIIWYGKANPPLNVEMNSMPEKTFAIRIYDGYVGKGLAKPFMRQSLQILVKSELEKGKNIDGIWLKTKTTNEAGKAVYSKFGYEEIQSDDKFIVMVLTPQKINQIIQN